MGRPVLITRMKGGLGNQLFAYAAARRLSLVNGVELVLDNVSVSKRENPHGRSFELHQFSIPFGIETPWERMEPLEGLRRGLSIKFSSHKPFAERGHISLESVDFDKRHLNRKLPGRTYIDGLRQGSDYFADIEETVRTDLRRRQKLSQNSQPLMEQIISSASPAALHSRDFDTSNHTTIYNLGSDYHERSVLAILSAVHAAHFFIFAKNTGLVSKVGLLDSEQVTVVGSGIRFRGPFEYLMLMSACHHFIAANSTFSSWGAWLGNNHSKIVTAQLSTITGSVTAWKFSGSMPEKSKLV